MAEKLAVVIDDEPDIVKYVSSILEDNGFTVKSAYNARDGELLVNEKRPDLILLDIMMPGRSGVQYFAKLRGDDQTKDIPLVMVTGIKEEMGIDWGEIVGKLKARKPDGFLEKPVDPERLMKVVSAVLSGESTEVQMA